MSEYKEYTVRVYDTRALFDMLTFCKPAFWEGIPTVDQFDDDQLEALRCLPLVKADPYSSPLNRFGADAAIEFLVDVGGTLYYVNTEGFDYCRYVFRIDPAWNDVILL